MRMNNRAKQCERNRGRGNVDDERSNACDVMDAVEGVEKVVVREVGKEVERDEVLVWKQSVHCAFVFAIERK